MKKILLFLLLIAGSNYSFGQFSESFEGTTTPTGWTVLAGGDAAQTWVLTDLAASTSVQAQNGTKVFSINYGTSAHNDFLVTPQFAVVAGVSDKISFWGRSRDPLYPETISVKASTTTATTAAMTTVLAATVAPASGANFVKYSIDLTALVGQSIYVGFQSTTNDQFIFDIDNVVVGGTPSCIEPVQPLVIGNIMSTSATLTWTAASPAPASGYDVVVSTSGTAPNAATTPSATVASGVTTFALTGLVANTKYYTYVRSKCSASSSSVWSHLGVFLTLPNPITPPYAYGFDNASGFLADGWSAPTTGTFSTNATAGNPQAGTQMIFSNNSSTAATNRWIFTPPISLQANSVNTLTFYVRNFTAATVIPGQSLKLTVGAANTVAAQTTTVYTSSTLNGSTWTQISTTYTPTVTGIYYFGFNHFSPIQTSAVSFALDTFSITSVLGTEDFTKNKLSVYPNPAKDLLNITSNGSVAIKSIQIVDLNGRQVIAKTFNNVSDAQINVNGLASGMYLINISSENGITTQKFLKQ